MFECVCTIRLLNVNVRLIRLNVGFVYYNTHFNAVICEVAFTLLMLLICNTGSNDNLYSDIRQKNGKIIHIIRYLLLEYDLH